MTRKEIREGFTKMIEAFKARGMAKEVAEMEIAREYFTRPKFRKAMEEYIWERTRYAK